MPGDTNGKHPIIDPTANVLSLVAAEGRRQDELRTAEGRREDDLRAQSEKFNDKLAELRRFFETSARAAEAGRIDALNLANKNEVALALAKQEAQAIAQDKRIAAVEQNQYQGVGAGTQRIEGRQHTQWLINAALIVAGMLLGFLSRFLGK